jgi:type II restriction enzyme
MRMLSYYVENNLNTSDEVFNFLTSTFRSSVADWQYFVNWDKVFSNTRELEVSLNTLNYVLGKENFDEEFRFLATKNPEVLKVIPALIVRNGANSQQYTVTVVERGELVEEKFDFTSDFPSARDIDSAIHFIRKSGLIRIFEKDGVKNLVDYVFGVEAGLSSNGRKNRGGTAMENVSKSLLESLGLRYISQASSKDIESNFGIKLNAADGRIFDFAVLADNGLNIIEVNCYSSGGSKLDKTASDYRNLQNELRGQATFIWITDGAGWLKTTKPLMKTFEINDYILNIHMVKNGALTEILEG